MQDQFNTLIYKKIRNLDPNSLIFILSDHYPPGVSDYKDAGFAFSTFGEYSCPKIRKMRIIFIGDDMQIDVEDRNLHIMNYQKLY